MTEPTGATEPIASVAPLRRRNQAARSAAMRERLLDATVDCLAELGYAGTTTTEVVRRAGVSRGAQVHHFPTKNDLVLGALEHVLERRHQEFRTAFGALPAERRSLANALDLLWAMYQSSTFTAWLELALAARTDADLQGPFHELCERFDAETEENFRQFFPDSPDGEFSRATVQFAFAVLDGLGLWRAIGSSTNGDEIVELLKALATMFSPQIGGRS